MRSQKLLDSVAYTYLPVALERLSNMGPIRRIGSDARMSQAVVANGFILLAGQVAGDP